MSKSNLIIELSLSFAINSISIYKKLVKEKEFVISKQFLKASTSIGANVSESIYAQSKPDFIHKLSIALKEARETEYWLILLKRTELTNIDLTNHLNDIREILRVLTSIIVTTKKNIKHNRK